MSHENTETETSVRNDESKQEGDSGQNQKTIWIRILYMLLFAIVFSIAETLIYLLAIVSVISMIIKDRPITQLVDFGADLSEYILSITRFLTFNDDQLPWPFSEWPSDPQKKT